MTSGSSHHCEEAAPCSSQAVHTGVKGIAKGIWSVEREYHRGYYVQDLWLSPVPACIDSQISEKQNLPPNTLRKTLVPDHRLISLLMPGCGL